MLTQIYSQVVQSWIEWDNYDDHKLDGVHVKLLQHDENFGNKFE